MKKLSLRTFRPLLSPLLILGMVCDRLGVVNAQEIGNVTDSSPAD